MAILNQNQRIGSYEVKRLIKENRYCETYRVEDEKGEPFFLKLYILKNTPEKMLDDEHKVACIEIMSKLRHKNIVSFVEHGTYQNEEVGECAYVVTNYFSGELLADKLQREGALPIDEALRIMKDVLEGLKFMHERSFFHNDITPRNIMLSGTTDGVPELIDLGHISMACNGKTAFDTSDLDVFYGANETFIGTFDEQSDIFSACAVLYCMLTGKAPWVMEFPEGVKRSRKATLLKDFRKENPLNLDDIEASERTKVVLAKGLAVAYGDRYRNISQLLTDLDGEAEPKRPEPKTPSGGQTETGQGGQSSREDSPNQIDIEIKKGNGNGFRDIAGMEELKTYLTQRVIFVIKDRERAEKYRITPPNGMLLYGPPGCGKTFVAEKFAEETGFNFALIKSSEKIAKLFKKAEASAPIVLCFDEFDALVPDRSAPGSQYVSSEVNEFLSQLNNCSARGIFVVATTNRPDKIDPAVLRTGRIDKQVYVPLPDKEARREMFLIHLQGRPCGEIDADRLSELSEGYIASDIAYVVNDAAMTAAFTDQVISEEILETAVKNTHPSLRKETLKTFEEIRYRMEGVERNNLRPKIGFV